MKTCPTREVSNLWLVSEKDLKKLFTLEDVIYLGYEKIMIVIKYFKYNT